MCIQSSKHCQCNSHTLIPAQYNSALQSYSQTVPRVHLACHTTLPNIIHGNWKKLWQSKIPRIWPFFYVCKPRQINNFESIHFLQQGQLTVHFSKTDGKNNCIFLLVPIHISGTTLTLMVTMQHPLNYMTE